MNKIDSHQHFWKFDAVRDAWITTEMQGLRKNFLPEDLLPLLEKNGVSGCVAIQADPSTQETDFLLSQAAEHSFVLGVVGWVDLQSPTLSLQLSKWENEKKLKGFRHLVQGEKDPEFLLRPSFLRGMNVLYEKGYSYDLLIYAEQLGQAITFLNKIPSELPIVLDHLAKPKIAAGEYREWSKQMAALAKHSNVFCKLSGLITEADWKHWKVEDLLPYMRFAIREFGPDRLLLAPIGRFVNLQELMHK